MENGKRSSNFENGETIQILSVSPSKKDFQFVTVIVKKLLIFLPKRTLKFYLFIIYGNSR